MQPDRQGGWVGSKQGKRVTTTAAVAKGTRDSARSLDRLCFTAYVE